MILETTDSTVVLNDNDARGQYIRLANLPKTSAARLMTARGDAIDVPTELYGLIRTLARLLADDRAVIVTARKKDLTTQQAADILGVSRPYLVRLLESGQIPFTKINTHRRVAYADLMAYQERRHGEAREHLTALTELNEEMGSYAGDAPSAVTAPA